MHSSWKSKDTTSIVPDCERATEKKGVSDHHTLEPPDFPLTPVKPQTRESGTDGRGIFPSTYNKGKTSNSKISTNKYVYGKKEFFLKKLIAKSVYAKSLTKLVSAESTPRPWVSTRPLIFNTIYLDTKEKFKCALENAK